MNNIKQNIRRLKVQINAGKVVLMVNLVIAFGTVAKAQFLPFQSMYYQNKYLYNPSLAGMAKELNINIAYRQERTTFPGAPKTGSFTADFPSGRTGLGLSIMDDQAGLIRQTRIMGTYAYHLPLSNQNQYLNFGLSLGVDDSRVNIDRVNGDQADIGIGQYNQLKAYVDGDFGIAYASESFNLGAAIPNLKAMFFNSSDSRFDADRLLFITMASYRFQLVGDDNFSLEPLMALRVVKGYTDIVDAGFNFNLNRYGLYFQGIYHSSKSIGIGIGLGKPSFAFSFSYNVETVMLNNHTQEAFELGLNLKLFRKE